MVIDLTKNEAGDRQKLRVIGQGQNPSGRGSIAPLPFSGLGRGRNHWTVAQNASEGKGYRQTDRQT